MIISVHLAHAHHRTVGIVLVILLFHLRNFVLKLAILVLPNSFCSKIGNQIEVPLQNVIVKIFVISCQYF